MVTAEQPNRSFNGNAHPHSNPVGSLKSDAALKRKLQELRATDNWTNLLYVARAYAIIALSIGGALWFFHARAAAGWSFWWNIPVWLLAVVAIGASQHQLAGATHEATHHTLFRNRWLNELVSDWLCMYPLFSSTYTFRLYHLAHHQFINDPVRDPDFAVLEKSGHWLGFPTSKSRFMGLLLRQTLIVGLVRYILTRAKYNAIGVDDANPYRGGKTGSKLPMRLGMIFMLVQMGLCAVLYRVGNPVLVLAVPALCWAALAAFYLRLPADSFESPRLKPVVSFRAQAICRTGFFTALFSTLTFIQLTTGQPAWRYFFLFWVVPVLTAFPFFMILRQLVQHGNGDRGWLTNTRVFLVNPLVKYAVFPFGMDYHLPHHMYATVPHFKLPALHDFLSQYPEYRAEGIVVENYFVPKKRQPPRNPTVLEVIGPEYAQHNTDNIYIDDSVLDDWEVENKEAILREGRGDPSRSDLPLKEGI